MGFRFQNFGNAVSETNNKNKLTGYLVKIILVFAVLIALFYVTNRLIAPQVVEHTQPVIGEIQQPASDSSQSDDGEIGGEKKLNEAERPPKIIDFLSAKVIESAEHPIDPLMKLADYSLGVMDEKYQDYSAKIFSQVRTNILNEETSMFVKLRHARKQDDAEVPFSIYTRFLSPQSQVGVEAIWVKGQNDGNILGHTTGLWNVKTIPLAPESHYAMKGNRYPIYQLGLRNLLLKMKEFGENDRKYDECTVEVQHNLMVDDRKCIRLVITHPKKRDHFEYHIAKIYIDPELEIPIGYEGFLWPEKEGDEPPLLERYIYQELKFNCGLEDVDFDTSNPDYDYPRY